VGRINHDFFAFAPRIPRASRAYRPGGLLGNRKPFVFLRLVSRGKPLGGYKPDLDGSSAETVGGFSPASISTVRFLRNCRAMNAAKIH
jgi:hypothetical protein